MRSRQIYAVIILQALQRWMLDVEAFVPGSPRCSSHQSYDIVSSTGFHFQSVRLFSSSTDSSVDAIDDLSSKTNDDQRNEHDHDHDASKPAPFSKAKWKKKRYLMMQDVTDLIKKADERAPRKAEETVARMLKLSEIHQDADLRPNEQVYNLWINAIAKCSEHPNPGQQAEEVLVHMMRDGVVPSTVSYTTVMDAYASSSNRRNNAAQEAERVLFDLLELQESQSSLSDRENLKLTSFPFDVVLKAWARRGDMEGAERAETILTRLEQMQNTNIRPTIHSYGTVVHAWASCKGGVPAAEKAEGILKRMLVPSSKEKPDTVIFNSVIHAWSNSKSPQTGQKASELLTQMRELHNPKKGLKTNPTERTYNNALAAWSHCDDSNAATETERIVKKMQEAYKKSPKTAPAPNTISFNSVLHAWSRSSLPGAVKRAQAVLQFMINADNPNIAPDVFSFTSVLNALAKSKEPDKAFRARKLLSTMISMYGKTKRVNLKPSQVPFNAVLNACAFSASDTSDEQKEDALKVAVTTFAELRTRSQPDTVSYGNLLKCYHNLMPPSAKRNEEALKLFDSCKEEGLVGELVWQELWYTVQAHVLLKHLNKPRGSEKMKLKDLPLSWTSNVRGDKLATNRRTQAEEKKRASKENSGRRKKIAPERRFRSITESSYQSGKDL